MSEDGDAYIVKYKINNKLCHLHKCYTQFYGFTLHITKWFKKKKKTGFWISLEIDAMIVMRKNISIWNNITYSRHLFTCIIHFERIQAKTNEKSVICILITLNFRDTFSQIVETRWKGNVNVGRNTHTLPLRMLTFTLIHITLTVRGGSLWFRRRTKNSVLFQWKWENLRKFLCRANINDLW